MTLTMVRLVGGPLDDSVIGTKEPLAERVTGEELQDMVEALPALRAALAGGEYELTNDPLIVEGEDEPTRVWYRWVAA